MAWYNDIFDAGLNTFEKWVDHELGADVAIEQQTRTEAAQIQAAQSPAVDYTASAAVAGFNVWTLAAVGGGLLLILLLLRR